MNNKQLDIKVGVYNDKITYIIAIIVDVVLKNILLLRLTIGLL